VFIKALMTGPQARHPKRCALRRIVSLQESKPDRMADPEVGAIHVAAITNRQHDRQGWWWAIFGGARAPIGLGL